MKDYIIESYKEAERLDFQNKIDVYNLDEELKSFKWSPQQSVLDAGCGHGNLIEKLMNLGLKNLHGLDISEKRLELAKKRFLTEPLVNFFQASLDNTGLPDCRYDVVICRYIFEHLTNTDEVLKELSRVTKQNGSIYIINFDDVFFNFYTKNETFNRQLKTLKGKLAQDFEIGRKLPQKLQQLGFNHVQWEAQTYFFQNERLKLEYQNTQMRLEQARPMLSKFFNSTEEYNAFAETYLNEMRDSCNVLSSTKFLITAKKAETKLLKLL